MSNGKGAEPLQSVSVFNSNETNQSRLCLTQVEGSSKTRHKPFSCFHRGSFLIWTNKLVDRGALGEIVFNVFNYTDSIS